MDRDEVKDWASVARNWLRAKGVEVTKTSSAGTLGAELAAQFARLGVDLVLDVGARFGEYGRFLRRNGYTGRIVSFEPVTATFATLDQRAGRDRSWETRQLAIGSENGTSRINITNFSSFSSLRQPTAFAAERFGKEVIVVDNEQIEVRRLDGLWDETVGSARAVFLKVDTQGWDLEVLRGASGCLDQVVGVQTEVSLLPVYEGSPSMAASVQMLADLGFGATGFFPVAKERDGRLIEMDCVAIRTPPLANPAGTDAAVDLPTGDL